MKHIKHPIIEHQLTIMRDKKTNSTLFRSCLNSVSSFLAFAATEDLKQRIVDIETPITPMKAKKTKDKIVLVPILRAGLGMVDAFKNMICFARIGHVGVYRDEKTFKAIEYYSKLPATISKSTVIVLDPMLATANSVISVINIIKKHKPLAIKFVCVVAAPEGIKKLEKVHPDVQCYCAAIDQKLNKNNYIVPGLGDAGDRIFGTK